MMQSFYLDRKVDVSGVSGTGIVAEGIVFENGQVGLYWLRSGSIGVYGSIGMVEDIHGHQGNTLVVMGTVTR